MFILATVFDIVARKYAHAEASAEFGVARLPNILQDAYLSATPRFDSRLHSSHKTLRVLLYTFENHISQKIPAMVRKTAPEDDDWQHVTDAKKRKQIQDRLAQRARRKYLETHQRPQLYTLCYYFLKSNMLVCES
jgi:hypothetical protein